MSKNVEHMCLWNATNLWKSCELQKNIWTKVWKTCLTHVFNIASRIVRFIHMFFVFSSISHVVRIFCVYSHGFRIVPAFRICSVYLLHMLRISGPRTLVPHVFHMCSAYVPPIFSIVSRFLCIFCPFPAATQLVCICSLFPNFVCNSELWETHCVPHILRICARISKHMFPQFEIPQHDSSFP
jgi:hypothetical protein